MTLPPAINWRFWPWCNYGCTFCFATFEDIDRSNSLEKELGFKLLEEMATEGVEKVTFVGGEPTLCPWLGELLVRAKELGLTTCIVSNERDFRISRLIPRIHRLGRNINRCFE